MSLAEGTALQRPGRNREQDAPRNFAEFIASGIRRVEGVQGVDEMACVVHVLQKS